MMKKMMRIVGVVLVLCLLLGTLTACHSKDEIAVTVDGVKLRTATYLCAMIQADQEGRQTVYNTLSVKSDFDSSATIDYASEKIEDTDFTTWVENRALEICKMYALNVKRAEEFKLTLTEEQIAGAKQQVDNYWNNYGYSYLFEKNGVSYDTYLDMYQNSLYESLYFLHLYGKEGTEPADEKEINEVLFDNYDLMYYLVSGPNDSEGNAKDESVLTEEKAKLNTLAAQINNGTKTFAAAYEEFNGEALTASEPVTDGSAPLDTNATLIASSESKTQYASEFFTTVHELGVGKAVVTTHDEYTYLFVRGDLKADPYYAKNLYDSALSIKLYDGFDKTYKEAAAALTAEKSSYATGRISISDFDYSEYQSYASYLNQYASQSAQ